jgi:hypothetical protein
MLDALLDVFYRERRKKSNKIAVMRNLWEKLVRIGAGEGNRTLVFSLEVVKSRNLYKDYSDILQPSDLLTEFFVVRMVPSSKRTRPSARPIGLRLLSEDRLVNQTPIRFDNLRVLG